MSDQANDETIAWHQHKQAKQERHRAMHQRNRELISASGIPYTDRGEALLFRQANKPHTDFYPSTGRWKAFLPGQAGVTYSGGAAKFLAWLQKEWSA